MKSTKLAAALSLCLAVGTLLPAMAADEPLEQAVQSALIVTRVGGVGTALVLGTPVAVMRQTCKTYKDMTADVADKIGGKDLGPSCLAASVVTIPASLVVGGLKGTFYGGRNAFTDGFGNPFSPASFSLGDKYED